MPGPESELHERMAWLIKAVGGQRAAAPIANASFDSINNFRKPGWKVPLNAAVALCRAVGVSLEWLASGRPRHIDIDHAHMRNLAEAEQAADFGDFVRLLPLMPDLQLVEGKKVERWAPSPLAFDPAWLTDRLGANAEALRYAFVGDDGMAPSVPRNTMAIVESVPDTSRRAGIYLVRLGEDLVARRLNHRPDGTAELVADADLTWRYALPDPGPELFRPLWFSRLA